MRRNIDHLLDNFRIGEMIKTYTTEHKIGPVELASKLDIHRTNIYPVFKKDSIDLHFLIELSLVLNHNFLAEISSKVDLLLKESMQNVTALEESARFIIKELNDIRQSMKSSGDLNQLPDANKKEADKNRFNLFRKITR